MPTQNQINLELYAAIQQLIDSAKRINALQPLSGTINTQDKIPLYRESTGETVYVNISELFSGGETPTLVDGSLATDLIIYGETLQAGELTYLKSDGKYWKADNTSETTSTTELRLIIESGVADDEKLALAQGKYTGTGFTQGLEYVGTNGSIINSRPLLESEVVRVVSTAVSATERYFNPSSTWLNGTNSKINGVSIDGVGTEFLDSVFTLLNSTNQTRKLKFDLSQISDNTERVIQWQDKDGIPALLSDIVSASIPESGVGVEHLDSEVLGLFQDKIAILNTDVINWANPYGTLLRAFTGTPDVVFTEVSVPVSGTKKTITIYMTGAVNSMVLPTTNTYIKMDGSADYDGTKMNLYVFEFVNSNVYYSNSLFTI